MKKCIIFGICSLICSILLISPSFIKVKAYPYGVDARLMIPFDTVVYSNDNFDYLFSFPFFYEQGSYHDLDDETRTYSAVFKQHYYDATLVDGSFDDFPFLYGRVFYSAGYEAVGSNYRYNKITFFAEDFFLDYDINYFNQYFAFYGSVVDVTATIFIGDYSYSYSWSDIDEENINLKDLFALVPIARGEVYFVDTLILEADFSSLVDGSSTFEFDLLTVDSDAYSTFINTYLDSLPQQVVTSYTINIFESLLTSIDSFFTTELIPGISIMVILGICLAVPLVIMLLKMWLGG